MNISCRGIKTQCEDLLTVVHVGPVTSFLSEWCHMLSDDLEMMPYLFIHSGHFYSASSSPLLLRSTPDAARILYRSFTPKRHRQLWVKDLPKVPTWPLKRDSYPQPSGRKALTLPMCHHVPHMLSDDVEMMSYVVWWCGDDVICCLMMWRWCHMLSYDVEMMPYVV